MILMQAPVLSPSKGRKIFFSNAFLLSSSSKTIKRRNLQSNRDYNIFFRKIPKRWQQRHHHLLATTAFADTGTDVAVTAAATSRRASSKRPNKNYSLLIHGPPGFIFPKNKARNQRPYKLVIVESPSKCQTINKILQGYVEEHDLKYDFVISSSMGKLRLLLFCAMMRSLLSRRRS